MRKKREPLFRIQSLMNELMPLIVLGFVKKAQKNYGQRPIDIEKSIISVFEESARAAGEVLKNGDSALNVRPHLLFGCLDRFTREDNAFYAELRRYRLRDEVDLLDFCEPEIEGLRQFIRVLEEEILDKIDPKGARNDPRDER
jgi:hypothetical protein